MGPRVKRLAGPILGVVLGLVVGFPLGQRQGFKMGMGFLEAQVSGTLSIHVEAASCIRVGDTKRALELLDMMIDSAVTSVVAQPGPLRAPGALSQAKLSRSVIPAAGPAASEVRTALERVPAMEVPPQTGASVTRSGLIRLARPARSESGNQKRRHSTVGYSSPADYERLTLVPIGRRRWHNEAVYEIGVKPNGPPGPVA